MVEMAKERGWTGWLSLTGEFYKQVSPPGLEHFQPIVPLITARTRKHRCARLRDITADRQVRPTKQGRAALLRRNSRRASARTNSFGVHRREAGEGMDERVAAEVTRLKLYRDAAPG